MQDILPFRNLRDRFSIVLGSARTPRFCDTLFFCFRLIRCTSRETTSCTPYRQLLICIVFCFFFSVSYCLTYSYGFVNLVSYAYPYACTSGAQTRFCHSDKGIGNLKTNRLQVT